MKFLVAFALIATAASAAILPLSPSQMVEIEQILEAIHSPSTNPATAAALEQMLNDYLSPPIIASPIIVPGKPENPPIHIGPEIIGEPIWVPEPIEIPEVPDVAVIPEPSPVVIPPPTAPTSNTPLVQIILNINQAAATPETIVTPEAPVPSPIVIVDESENHIEPSPIIIVDEAENHIVPTPIIIVDEAENHIVPTPIIIVDEAENNIAPTPIQIVEVAPQPIQIVEVAPEPVLIAQPAPIIVDPIQIAHPAPIVPAPIVNLPAIIN